MNLPLHFSIKGKNSSSQFPSQSGCCKYPNRFIGFTEDCFGAGVDCISNKYESGSDEGSGDLGISCSGKGDISIGISGHSASGGDDGSGGDGSGSCASDS